jgi:hypothetical protein
MTIRELLAPVTTLNDLTVIQDAFERLVNERREQILRQKMAAGQQVGMVAEKGRGERKSKIPVNGVVKEVKGNKAVIVISAPVKHSGTRCRAPFQLICDAFDLTRKKESPFADQEVPTDEEEATLLEGDGPD